MNKVVFYKQNFIPNSIRFKYIFKFNRYHVLNLIMLLRKYAFIFNTFLFAIAYFLYAMKYRSDFIVLKAV